MQRSALRDEDSHEAKRENDLNERDGVRKKKRFSAFGGVGLVWLVVMVPAFIVSLHYFLFDSRVSYAV